MAAYLSSEVRMRDLYAPELLRVVVGPSKRTFNVPRGLICSKSIYFDKAFQRLFREGQQGCIDLPDVDEWVFECFTAWLYTERIFWEPLDDTTDAEGPSPQPPQENDDEENHDENERHNPVTWQYKYLIDLYLFGDEYDTKEFRNAAMHYIQLKTRQSKPKEYSWPSDSDSCTVFKGLPENSTLYRFILDAHVFNICPDPIKHGGHFVKIPHDAMSRIAKKAIQLARCLACDTCSDGRTCTDITHVDVKQARPDYEFDMCSYHEHNNQAEQDACRKKWKDLRKTHGVFMFA